ncbi:MAG: tRNA (adenosine(37)-N6)-dimethylallyltransferase MiaA [Bacteroidales bacterium]|nr:tRNA (adenosine(37)-N6)-dimethylallyltransferase MiaA [Bacteroidales bacterium]
MATPDKTHYDLVSILGPTASGKTTFAAQLAHRWQSEVVSADSRQVYRRMDIGTGKDLADYVVEGEVVPYHLIDIAEPGEHYNIYRYQHDFLRVYRERASQLASPLVLCGGSGLYAESVLRGYRLYDVPENAALRAELAGRSLPELTALLANYKALHNTTDVDTVQRAIRAIEIAAYYADLPAEARDFPTLRSLNVCFELPRELRRERISMRLAARLDEGMLDEVQQLLDEGLTPEQLIYYGLEYKFVTQHLVGELSREQLLKQLEIAIHQFAKRQMTWFRGMERRGVQLYWLDATLPTDDKIAQIEAWLTSTKKRPS